MATTSFIDTTDSDRFPYTENATYASGGLTKDVRTITTPLGNGYQEAVVDGVNISFESWNLSFELTAEELKIVQAFLDRKATTDSFKWTTPAPSSQDKLWVAGAYNVSQINPDTFTLSVTFREVYN